MSRRTVHLLACLASYACLLGLLLFAAFGRQIEAAVIAWRLAA